jgi:hypothetical protein
MVPTLGNTVLDYTFEKTIDFNKNDIIHSSTLIMEAAGSCEMFIHFYHTTQCHIPDDSNLAKPYILHTARSHN